MQPLRILALGLLAGLFTASASAQATITWSGQGQVVESYTYFDNTANWVGGVLPAAGDHLVFGAAPTQQIYLNAPHTAGNITFSGIQNGYYFYGSTLTLSGNVTTTAGSNYWGLFNSTVELSAGNHTYTAGGNASLYHFGAVSGAGGITKNGPNGLYLTVSGTYTGGTILNAGTLSVGADHALGFGPVTLNGGILQTAYAEDDITLGNNFILGSNVNIRTTAFFSDEAPVSLTLGNGDNSTITPGTGVTTVNFKLAGPKPLELAGSMQDGSSPTTYTFASDEGSVDYVLSMANSYTGGTVVKSGASVVFSNSGAIPGTGLITAESGAYVGITSAAAQAVFLGRLDPATFAGVIGLEGGQTYAGNIDLSAFTANDGSASLGTRDSATLTGLITPSGASGVYHFQSSGTLYLAGSNPLTGNRDVISRSFSDRPPGLLVLNQSVANDHTGNTVADGAGIVFDGPFSLTETTSVQLANGGYVSVTDAWEYSLGDLAETVTSVAGHGVLGYDSHDYIHGGNNPATYAAPVDFSGLGQTIYLGSASATTITGTITTGGGGTGDYLLTGYRGGKLSVGSLLTGNKAVHIGLPGVYQDTNPSTYSRVELTNSLNDYTGDTVLHSGYLQITDVGALGTGDIVMQADASNSSAAFKAPNGSTVTNSLVLDTGLLHLDGQFTISGNISGSGSLQVNQDMTLSGNNSHSGETTVHHAELIAGSDTALGTGGISLTQGGQIRFLTATPSIGSLINSDSYSDNTDGYIQIDPALRLAFAGNSTLTINQTQDGWFYGAVVETGSTAKLIKEGSGSLTIYGYNYDEYPMYSGGTEIKAGRLIAGADDALGTGTIVLNGGSLGMEPGVVLANPIQFGAGGGTLSGSGPFATPITVGPNAVLAPGNSPGTMTFTSGLTLAGGGTLEFEVQSANGVAGTGYDLVSVSSGDLEITATSGNKFTLRLISLSSGGLAGAVSDFSSNTAYSWLLFRANSTDGINGFDGIDPDAFAINVDDFVNGLGGGIFTLVEGMDGSNPALFLNFTPVPEPSTYALMVAGLGAVFLAWRRKRLA